MNPFRLLERIVNFLARLPDALLAGAGCLFLAGTLLACSYITRKDIAVAVAMAGTFIGTALLGMFLPKWIAQRVLERAEANKREMVRLREENQKAEQTRLEAEREIQRLETMRVNLDAFQSVLKLGLLEVDMRLTDFRRISLGPRTEEKWLKFHFSGAEPFYVGVVEVPLKAQLGIDLRQLKVRELQDRLIISNIQPTHTLDTTGGPEWKLDEVRLEYYKEGVLTKVESDPADARVKQASREHEAQIRQRLKQGQDFACFENGLKKAAHQALTVLLSPLGKSISFVDGDQGGDDLSVFLQKAIEEKRARMLSNKKGGEDFAA